MRAIEHDDARDAEDNARIDAEIARREAESAAESARANTIEHIVADSLRAYLMRQPRVAR